MNTSKMELGINEIKNVCGGGLRDEKIENWRSLDKLNATLPDLMQLSGKRAVESVEKDRRLSHPSHSKATTNCGKRGKIRDFPTLTTVNEGNGASRISTLYFTGSHPKR